MRKKIVLTLIVTITALTGQQAEATVQYNLIDLGTIDGYNISMVWHINNNGQIVGDVRDITNYPPKSRAVLFDNTGQGNNIDLGTLGGEYSCAMSINNNGQIVGTAQNDSNPPISEVTLFNATSTNTAIYPNAGAWSINDSGQIAGSVPVNINNEQYDHAALFDVVDPGNYTDLGVLEGFDSSEIVAINNNSVMVGYARNCNSQYPWNTQAVLFNMNGGNTDLGSLDGYDYSLAFSVNNIGQIVGRANFPALDIDGYNGRALLFDPSGSGNNIDLGTVGDYIYAEALSINNHGQIVGRAMNDPFPYHPTSAVLFDPTGQGHNIDLNDTISPSANWHLSMAICINDNGWIVGWGTNPDGYSRSFLLKPVPEPVTILLLGFGIIYMRKKQS